jgi:hypothetical protein
MLVVLAGAFQLHVLLLLVGGSGRLILSISLHLDLCSLSGRADGDDDGPAMAVPGAVEDPEAVVDDVHM